MTIGSYPTIYAVGHKAIQDLLDGEVVIEEKLDGSQFSFSLTQEGKLSLRSKGQMIHPEAPPSLFAPAVDYVKTIASSLIPGWIYRGEAFFRAKHNSLEYGRVPKGNVVLFDIETGPGQYASPREKIREAIMLGLEPVPVLAEGRFDRQSLTERAQEFLKRESVLGGQVEGIVIKNYGRFGPDKKILVGKIVSPRFQEVNRKSWKAGQEGQNSILEQIVERYRTPARWQKALVHLREQGLIEGVPQDIPLLLREVNEDVLRECEDEIKELLFKRFWKELSRRITRGLPEWYKSMLEEEAA